MASPEHSDPSASAEATDSADTRTIHLMSDTLASQVAAGEVVERPASVIKELVENSLDAGATSIRVDIERGGIALMRVTDDGRGMSHEDAQMCLMRHATSKIRDFGDLFDIRHLGFRGEALPSIASVSQMSITTRRADDVEGTQIRVQGGMAEEPRNAGCAPGTCIEVAELFYNTPVRRKFLKKDDTEAAHIEQQLMLHALVYPEVRFVFTKQGQTVFDTAATKDLRQRIADFMGRELARELIEMEPTQAPGVSISGYLLPLSAAKRNRRLQFLFLNGRPIEDKMLMRALRDGFGGLPTGLHPTIFLYIKMDPALVDVNVHPAKKEVRFRRMNDVCHAIIDSIRVSLSRHARQGEEENKQQIPNSAPPTPSIPSLPQLLAAPTQLPPASPTPAPSASTTPLRPLLRPLVPRERQTRLPLPDATPEQLSLSPEPAPLTSSPPAAQDPAPSAPSATPSSPTSYPAINQQLITEVPHFRHIGQLDENYILFEGKEGLVMLSPRAARERLIFERLLTSKKRPIASQQLLLPVLIEVDARDMGTLRELLPQLTQAGFAASIFGQRSLRIESLPTLLRIDELEDFILELIECFSSRGDVRLGRSRNPYETFITKLAAQYAAQESLQPFFAAAHQLLGDLLCCEIPYCTPTGKPTLVPISLNEIKRKFQTR